MIFRVAGRVNAFEDMKQVVRHIWHSVCELSCRSHLWYLLSELGTRELIEILDGNAVEA